MEHLLLPNLIFIPEWSMYTLNKHKDKPKATIATSHTAVLSPITQVKLGFSD